MTPTLLSSINERGGRCRMYTLWLHLKIIDFHLPTRKCLLLHTPFNSDLLVHISPEEMDRPTGAYLTWGNGQTYWCLSHLRKWTDLLVLISKKMTEKMDSQNDYSIAMLSEKYCCNCVYNFSKYLLIIHIPKLRMPHAFSPHWNYAMKGLSQERIKQKIDVHGVFLSAFHQPNRDWSCTYIYVSHINEHIKEEFEHDG